MELNTVFEQLQSERIDQQTLLKRSVSELHQAALADAAKATPHTDSINQIEWSADGKLLASCSRDRTIVLCRLEDGALEPIVSHQLGRASLSNLAWRADQPVLAASCLDGQLWVVDFGAALESGGQVTELAQWQLSPPRPGLLPSAYAVAFNSDGSMLAVGGRDDSVLLYDKSFELIRKLVGGHGAAVTQLRFSGDDRFLASAGLDNTVRIWSPSEAVELDQVIDSIQKQWEVVQHESTTEERASWQQQMREMELSVQKAVLLGLSDKPHGIAWRPVADGKYVLAAAAEGDMSVGLWRLPKIKR